MSIKFILNSGGMRNTPEGSKKFFADAAKGLGDNPKVLICFFAQPREDWEKKFTEDQENLPGLFPEGVVPAFDMAYPETFVQQIKDSDIIFIRGGDDNLLQYWFKKFNLPQIFEGKVVAGTSAGTSMFTKHFWTCDWRKNMDGFGILPIKFIPHFKSSFGADDPRGPINWDKAYKDLELYGDTTLPIYALKEGEHIVIEQ